MGPAANHTRHISCLAQGMGWISFPSPIRVASLVQVHLGHQYRCMRRYLEEGEGRTTAF